MNLNPFKRLTTARLAPSSLATHTHVWVDRVRYRREREEPFVWHRRARGGGS